MLASGLFHGEISVVMLAFVFASLEKTRLNLLNMQKGIILSTDSLRSIAFRRFLLPEVST